MSLLNKSLGFDRVLENFLMLNILLFNIISMVIFSFFPPYFYNQVLEATDDMNCVILILIPAVNLLSKWPKICGAWLVRPSMDNINFYDYSYSTLSKRKVSCKSKKFFIIEWDPFEGIHLAAYHISVSYCCGKIRTHVTQKNSWRNR